MGILILEFGLTNIGGSKRQGRHPFGKHSDIGLIWDGFGSLIGWTNLYC